MKHLFKSVKSTIAFLLAAAFLCGGMTALTHTGSSFVSAKKGCLQAVAPSDSALSDDWDISDFI